MRLLNTTNCDPNVYVKALAIDKIEHELIECSSVKRGICRRRILGNISNIVEESNRKLVPSGSDGQVTAFVTMTCGSDICENKELNKQTLFLGITPTVREDTQYLVAGYDLKKGDQLNLLSNAFQGLYLSFTNAKSQAVNQIDYVTAFDYEKYVYFVIRQNHANSPSKLARICKDDPTFYSYSEIPLNCKTPSGEVLSYVHDAYVGNPQYYLAEEFHGSTIDNIQLIFAVFTDKFHHEFTDYSTSGICVFNMEDVSKQFTNAHRYCNAGKGIRGFDYHPSGVRDCTLNALTNFECGNEVNPHVFGSEFPVEATTFIHREKEFFTSIYVHGVKGTNVGFIGTSTGALHKALIINSTASKIFKTIQLTDDGSPILQDKKFVMSHASSINTPTLFLLSKYAVYKIKVDHCDKVDNCIDCVQQENPFCGWCLKSNTCSRDNECPEDVTLIDGFKQYITYQDSRSCPSILSISPNQQYIAVSRNLTISTQNIASSPSLECVFDIENVQRQRKKAENLES
uniref:Sema domain-containing protein n=1 Tax=Panagrolaimus davidi TaxID=227884 RepID=A0A914PZM0_9BILA